MNQSSLELSSKNKRTEQEDIDSTDISNRHFAEKIIIIIFIIKKFYLYSDE